MEGMYRIAALVLAALAGLLALIGYVVEGEHLFGLMNVDLTLDVLRTVLAIALLVVALAPVHSTVVRAVLFAFGALYVIMGLYALADANLFGALPTGLTGFDIAFHIVVGLATLAVAAMRDRGWRADRTAANHASGS